MQANKDSKPHLNTNWIQPHLNANWIQPHNCSNKQWIRQLNMIIQQF